MFSLIIAIVSIALIVAVVAISSYFSGQTLTEAQAQADAARLKNEEQQLIGAVEMFQAQHGRWPSDVQELVTSGMLKSVPAGVHAVSASLAPASLFDFLPRAYAQSVEALGWSTVVAGQPIYMTTSEVPQLTCRKYNLVSRGDDGILKDPFLNQRAQCYGQEGAYRIVVSKTGQGIVGLGDAMTPTAVVDGGLPAGNTGDIWWNVPPSATPKGEIDPAKVPYARLTLQPTTSVNFGELQVGLHAKSGSRTVINEGNVAATSVSVVAPDGFTVADNACGESLSPGASCSFAVSFDPTESRNYAGQAAVGSSNGGSASFEVSGVGRRASASVASLDFGNVPAGAVRTAVSTVRNTGVGPLTLGAVSVTGSGFSLASGSTCAGSLAAGDSCDVRVQLAAQGTTGHSGTLTVPTAQAGTLTAELSAQSQMAALSVSQSTVAFGDVQVGETVVSGLITLTNTGNIPATSVARTLPSGFSLTDSTCSAIVAGGANCAFRIAFSPVAEQPYGGDAQHTSANAGGASIAVSGSGRAQSATLTSVNFGNQAAASSADRTAVLSNTGVGPLAITTPNAASVVGEGFVFAGTTCGASLPAGGNCGITVRYAATGTANAAGSLTVNTGAGTRVATLAGQSQQAILEVLPAERAFGAVQVGQAVTSPAHVITNKGNIPLSGLNLTAPATNFTLAGSTCAASLAAGASCSFSVVFTPVEAKVVDGQVSVASTNAGTKTVGLSGEGKAQSATLSALSFGNRAAGSQTVLASTLQNTGVGPLTLTLPSAASVTGAGFAFAGTDCTATLQAGASCSVSVRYTADTTAAATGALTLSTSAGEKAVALTGMSQQAVLVFEPANLAFGDVQVGQSSVKQFVIRNTGNIASTGMAGGSLTAGYVVATTGPSPCGPSLAAGASCNAQVTFSPSAAQVYNGAYTSLAGNAATISLGLSGAGVAPAATLTPLSFGSLAAGGTRDLAATLTNTGIGPLSVTTPTSGSVTGAGFSLVNTNCPASLAVNATCTTTVRYTASGASAATGALNITTGAGVKTAALSGQSQQTVLTLSYPGHTAGVHSPNWGNQQVGAQATSDYFTVTNTGNLASNALVLTVPAGWSTATSTCSASLAPGATCRYSVTFVPMEVKAYSGITTVMSAGATSTTPYTLSGNGVSAQMVLASVDGTAAMGLVGAASDSGRWPVWRNSGIGPVEIRGHSVNNSIFWAWQGTTDAGYCYIGKVLAAGEQCKFFVGIGGSTTLGDHSVTESVTFRAQGTATDLVATQAYTAGIRTTTASVPSISFGNAAMNTWSPAQTIRLTNNATGNPLRNLAVSITGAHAGNFRILSNGCGAAVGAGASCDITVQFNPTWAANGFQAQVNVQGGYPRMEPGETAHIPYTGVNITIPLAGNAVYSAATLTSANDLTHSSWYGEADKYMAFTYRNDGNTAMSLSSPGLTMPLYVAGNDCSNIGPGAGCTITVGMRSTGAGAGGSSNQTFTAIGATTNPAAVVARWNIYSAVPRWSTTSLNFGNVTVNQSSTQTITLYNDGSTAYDWRTNSSIAALPAGYSIDLSACSSVAPWGGSCTAYVTFRPTTVANGQGGGGIYPAAASYVANTLSVTGNGIAAGYTAAQFSCIRSQTGTGGGATWYTRVTNLTGVTLTLTGGTNWPNGGYLQALKPTPGYIDFTAILNNGQTVKCSGATGAITVTP